jgi:hypothetical protein
MKNFDDFDTQQQADEYEWEEEFWIWYNSQHFSYKVYEVQDSDDLIYEWAK